MVNAVQDSKKHSKKEVNYSKGMRRSRCGMCFYYHPTSEDKNKGICQKVKGSISEDMWCKLFKPEYKT